MTDHELSKDDKRQRNTEAARRSRERKQQQLRDLEQQVKVLQSENHQLRINIATLERERDLLKVERHSQWQRITSLERIIDQTIQKDSS